MKKTRKNAALAALLFTITFLASALAQSPEQKTTFGIADIAEKITDAPSWAIAARDDAHHRTSVKQGAGPFQNCPDWLIGKPAMGLPDETATVAFVTGCNIPVGSIIFVESNFGDHKETETRRVKKTIVAGSTIVWHPYADDSADGGKFSLMITPTDSQVRTSATTFNAPVTFRAYERITQGSPKPNRTLVIEGITLAGARVRFGPLDLTGRASTTSDPRTTEFDVNGVDFPQGRSYPLTIAQGPEYITALVLHPNCEDGRCSSLALPQPAISITRNFAVGDQTFPAGVASAKIGSYTLSSAQAKVLRSVTLLVNLPTIQNIWIGIPQQFGGTFRAITGPGGYNFSDSTPIQANGNVTINVYADIPFTATTGTFATATALKSVEVSDGPNGPTTVVVAGTLGQTVTVIAGPPSLNVYASTINVASRMVMGSTGNKLGEFYVSNVGREDTWVTEFAFTDRTTSKLGAVTNMQLFRDGQPLGTAAVIPSGLDGYRYSFHLSPQALTLIETGHSIPFEIRGDIASFVSGDAEDNSIHTFGVVSAQGTGKTTGRSSDISLSNTFAQPITVLRTDLSVNVGAINGAQHTRGGGDSIGVITLTANQAGPVSLTKLTINFLGSTKSLLSSVANIALVDQNGLDLGTIGAANVVADPNRSTVTWSFGNYVIAAGTFTRITLRINSLEIPTGGTLSAFFAQETDVLWSDGLDPSATTGLGLRTALTPLVINTVKYN